MRVRKQHDRFGFVLAQSRLPHHSGTVARFVCTECGSEAEVRPKHPLNPEDVAKRCARDFGWECDGYRKSLARCPACIQRHKEAGKGESPGKVVALHAPPIANQPQRELPMTVPKPGKTELTNEERLKIRNLLDKHFDDQAGCYLDGYSDQKIGEELNVPWSLVAKVREVGWGPVRIDPEVTGLRNQIHAVEVRIETIEKSMAKALEALRVDLTAMKTTLASIEKRRSVA